MHTIKAQPCSDLLRLFPDSHPYQVQFQKLDLILDNSSLLQDFRRILKLAKINGKFQNKVQHISRGEAASTTVVDLQFILKLGGAGEGERVIQMSVLMKKTEQRATVNRVEVLCLRYVGLHVQNIWTFFNYNNFMIFQNFNVLAAQN